MRGLHIRKSYDESTKDICTTHVTFVKKKPLQKPWSPECVLQSYTGQWDTTGQWDRRLYPLPRALIRLGLFVFPLINGLPTLHKCPVTNLHVFVNIWRGFPAQIANMTLLESITHTSHNIFRDRNFQLGYESFSEVQLVLLQVDQ